MQPGTNRDDVFEEEDGDHRQAKSIGSDSSRKYLLRERRILDKIPRNDRLKSRTPWGSLAVLDDYGLLDGGTSVPNYYTSLRQRSRRCLEMKARSSRLRDRGKKGSSLILESLHHMLRVLTRRNIDIAEYCRERDTSGRGMLDKKQLWELLSMLGLPFRPRDIDEVVQRYSVPSSDLIDYECLLRDAQLFSSSQTDSLGPRESFSGSLSAVSGIMNELKELLHLTVESLHISLEDLYRKFARYDVHGTGTITATQFFRVLSQLHVHYLEDHKQDFFVELHDINGDGRINFEVFLSFVFAEKLPLTNSPYGMTMKSLYGTTATGNIANSLSDSASTSSFSSSSIGPLHSSPDFKVAALSGHYGGSVSAGKPMRPHTASTHREQASTALSHLTVSSNLTDLPMEGRTYVEEGMRSRNPQRPLTASARVPTVTSDDYDRYRHHRRQSTSTFRDTDDSLLELDERDDDDDLDDDGFIADDDGICALSQSLFSDERSLDRGDLDGEDIEVVYQMSSKSPEEERPVPAEDLCDEWPRESGPLREPEGFGPWISRQDQDKVVDTYVQRALKSVRELVKSRQQEGKRLQDIFVHFERRGLGMFDALDMRRAAADLRIELTPEESAEAVRTIAIDGVDKVSYGEFSVFINDIDHAELQGRVQQAVAEQLERLGRTYGESMTGIFERPDLQNPVHKMTDSISTADDVVTPMAFSKGLQDLGLDLAPTDVNRLITRFDIHGTGYVSVTRFVRMVQHNSVVWSRKLLSLNYYEMAKEEQREALRLLLVANSQAVRASSAGGTVGTAAGVSRSLEAIKGLDEGIVEMAAYLGIGVFSESHLLWIASEALRAPLPSGWTMQTDEDGRTLFVNNTLHQTRYDHPLDPYFRKLRDQERFGVSSSRNEDKASRLSPESPLDTQSISLQDMPQCLRRSTSSLDTLRQSSQSSNSHALASGSVVLKDKDIFQGSSVLNRPRPKSAYPATSARADEVVGRTAVTQQQSYAVKWFEVKPAASEVCDQQVSKPLHSAPKLSAEKLPSKVVNPRQASRPATAPFMRPKTEQTNSSVTSSEESEHVTARFTMRSDAVPHHHRGFSEEITQTSICVPPVDRHPKEPDRDPVLKKLSPYMKNPDQKPVGVGSKRISVVDRALTKNHYASAKTGAHRRASPVKTRPVSATTRGSRKEETREQKLATMYKDDLLGQLDALIAGRRLPDTEHGPAQARQRRNHP